MDSQESNILINLAMTREHAALLKKFTWILTLLRGVDRHSNKKRSEFEVIWVQNFFDIVKYDFSSSWQNFSLWDHPMQHHSLDQRCSITLTNLCFGHHLRMFALHECTNFPMLHMVHTTPDTKHRNVGL